MSAGDEDYIFEVIKPKLTRKKSVIKPLFELKTNEVKVEKVSSPTKIEMMFQIERTDYMHKNRLINALEMKRND